MKRPLSFAFALLLFASAPSGFARDVARDLRKMTGFTIILADTVEKVITHDGNKYIKLSGGRVFQVEFLLLDPLVLTDVIVFAKPASKTLLEKYRGKVPDHMLYSYRLLVDNELFDAHPK